MYRKKLVVGLVCLINGIALVLVIHDYTIITSPLCLGNCGNNTTTFRSRVSSRNASKLSDRFVSFGKYVDGRGLGNLIFDFAALLHVSELTGRQPAIFNSSSFGAIESITQVFDLGIASYDEAFLCPCETVGEAQSLGYDGRFEELAFNDTASRTMMLMGFYQSWKYLRSMDRLLRRHLVFRRHIADAVDRFLVDSVPENWVKGFIRVGIHVRRGDVVSESALTYGFTVPDENYFDHAMTYFVGRFASRIQFVVASNDMAWCRKAFESIVQRLNSDDSAIDVAASILSPAPPRHSIVYADNFSAGNHLAMLASCDHVIMSTGTFGWWAAWLAKGETVYYADWPRNNSVLGNSFNKADFFPPSWIAMS